MEYALRSVAAPIGVAEYRVMVPGTLPDDLAWALPTAKEIEERIGGTSTGVNATPGEAHNGDA